MSLSENFNKKIELSRQIINPLLDNLNEELINKKKEAYFTNINFTFEAYKTFTVKIIHELEDRAQIVIGSDEQIKKGDMEHYFNIPMSANDFGRLTAKEFLAQLKQNLELRLNKY